MRDFIILAIILGSVPICFFRPYFGVLMWSWIAYFSPHRFAWGPAYHFPVAVVIAIPTLAGLLFARQMNRKIFTREAVLLFMLWIWFGVTLIYAANEPRFAAHVAEGTEQFGRVSKILLMTVVTILLVTSQKKLKYLFLVTAFSFGVLAVKGAVFGFRTSGQFRVWGPPDSFIADNNDMALALNMSLPMLFFLAREERNRTLRMLLWIAFLCGMVSVVLTYSRGGLLGLAAVLAFIAIRSRRKLIGVSLVLVCGFLILSFAPPQWMARMNTMATGSVDDSVRGRFIVWRYAWNLAHDYPITGGGFGTFPDSALFQTYASEPMPPGYEDAGPHSIYFQVLGEQGFVGLALFLALPLSSWLTLEGICKRARKVPSTHWMIMYSYMLEGSLLAFMVSGAFLGRAYFDLFYQLIASIVVMKIIYRREVIRSAQAAEPAPVVAEEGELVAS